jgi:hypothetical protein
MFHGKTSSPKILDLRTEPESCTSPLGLVTKTAVLGFFSAMTLMISAEPDISAVELVELVELGSSGGFPVIPTSGVNDN